MSISIDSVNLDCSREPLRHVFGFKGSGYSEKWFSHVTLEGGGHSITATAGLAILWSDADLFASHSETGGNLLSLAVLEWALQSTKGQDYASPHQLFQTLREPAFAYARRITGLDGLRETFVLNSLVGLDNAAWLLRMKTMGVDRFDAMLCPEEQSLLSERHASLAQIPLISYSVPMEEVTDLAHSGHFLFKIKLGNGASPEEMLEKDIRRLEQIHHAIGGLATPSTDDGRIRYYLDANGCYLHKDLIHRLLDAARKIGMEQQILLLEEPFPEGVSIDVHDLDVLVAADESLHHAQDVKHRAQLGYRAVALKPAGKSLTATLAMLSEARRLGMHCFVADSTCTPAMIPWNYNVAARLPSLPGVRIGVLESNGEQHYRHWESMLSKASLQQQKILNAQRGIFELGESFFDQPFPLI